MHVSPDEAHRDTSGRDPPCSKASICIGKVSEIKKQRGHPLEKKKLILHQSLRENRIWLLSRSSLKWFLANNGLW